MRKAFAILLLALVTSACGNLLHPRDEQWEDKTRRVPRHLSQQDDVPRAQPAPAPTPRLRLDQFPPRGAIIYQSKRIAAIYARLTAALPKPYHVPLTIWGYPRLVNGMVLLPSAYDRLAQRIYLMDIFARQSESMIVGLLAHEYGHAVLHRKIPSREQSRDEHWRDELQADAFAIFLAKRAGYNYVEVARHMCAFFLAADEEALKLGRDPEQLDPNHPPSELRCSVLREMLHKTK